MEDAHSSLSDRGDFGTRKALSILAVAPLSFCCDGKETFLFGGSVFYAELLPRLAQLGHAVRVMAEAPAAQGGQQRTGLPWNFPNLSVEWFACEYHRGATPPPPASLAVLKEKIQPAFDRLVREQQPDIVIIGREALVWSIADLCREYHLPSLLIVHGSPTAGFLRGNYPEAARQSLLERFSQVDGIVTVATYLQEILSHYGITPTCTIPNLADPARFRPEPKDRQLLRGLHIAPHQVVVGHVSTLKANKEPIDIVRSAELVLKANPHVVYLIVGDGPCRQDMEELGRKRGIADNFRYVGEISHRQVPQYLNLADIVLLPSKKDGVPPLLAYRETQACGRVLLATDVPAAREAIVDGETGVLFHPGDLQDLVAKTLALVGDPALRQRIGEQARAGAATRTLDHWVRAYENVLRRTALRVSPLGVES